MAKKGPISEFMLSHYHHFNAAAMMDAAKAYEKHINDGGLMMVTLGGAMSTAELGRSLAAMIREGKVHAITCTGANLEEDVFNLVAHNDYKRVPNYRDLTPEQELALRDSGMNRVTDTCIPEETAMRKIEHLVLEEWKKADKAGETHAPYEYLFKILANGKLEKEYQIDPKNSWMLAAMEKNIPIFTPGWEDSTLGNMMAAAAIRGDVKSYGVVESGIQLMMRLADWYKKVSQTKSVGFYQIGGGISGDFPICVVPMLEQDLRQKGTRLWGYFCQISDSTTSYGSYSGAVPNEKITWGKLAPGTPSFIVESDATIVAPLMFAYILGW